MKAFRILSLIFLLNSVDCFFQPRNSSRNGRVHGGTPASLGEFPFFAFLEARDVSHYYIDCGGTFIRYDFVLTAAHCLVGKVDVAVFGGHVVWRGFYEFHTLVLASDLIPHENWSPSSVHVHNIGLIRMRQSTPEIFNGNYVRPIALPTASDGQNSFEGYTLRVMGFGLGSNLYTGLTNVILNSQCSQTFPLITSGNICITPAYGIEPCRGDDGGTGMVNRLGERIVIGVLSSPNEYCGGGSASVYTRVTSYLNWIQSHMN